MKIRELTFICFNKLNYFLKKFNFLSYQSQNSKLFVFLLHSTDKKNFDEYNILLKRINSKAPFIDPSDIENFFNGKLGKGSKSLLTFDDGFKNNFLFSTKVLDPLSIKAIFLFFFLINKNKITYFNSVYPGNIIGSKT